MTSWSGVVQYLGSFALVVALLVGLLWSLKRLQGAHAFARREQRLRVVESMAMGARLKIALVRCDGHELLVGITPSQITQLGSWRAIDPASSPAGASVSFLSEPRP